MPQTPDAATATMIANLPKNTGKSLEQWLDLLRPRAFTKHGEIVKVLKSEHGVGHGYANLIAHHALAPADQPPPGDDALVNAQYAGAKAALRPIYEAIVAAVRRFGGDVEVAPKRTYVSLRRRKQFALIQASTATRVDVGIHLKGDPPTTRLEASGSFNAMVSHRVRVQTAAEADQQLVGWLKRAYEQA